MTSGDSNFNFLCGRPHGAWHLPSLCQHASTWSWPPSPFRVDVINGWPLNYSTGTLRLSKMLFHRRVS